MQGVTLGWSWLQVLVDGCDVREVDVQWLRGRVGLVSQEPVLFSCSVRDNICYGNPEATQQQVEDAARAANAHSFIQKLPEGYSTQVYLVPHAFSNITATHARCLCAEMCKALGIIRAWSKAGNKSGPMSEGL